jgi:YVTN family beta-propeller protein
VANSALFDNSTYSRTISVINTFTNTVVGTVPIGVNPVGVVTILDGSKVYVTNAFDGSVSVINTATNKVTTIIPVGQFIG